jgi:hypothetical protein
MYSTAFRTPLRSTDLPRANASTGSHSVASGLSQFLAKVVAVDLGRIGLTACAASAVVTPQGSCGT